LDKNTDYRSNEYLFKSHTQQISKIEKLASQLQKRSKEAMLAFKRSCTTASEDSLPFPSDLDIESHFSTLIPHAISMNDNKRFEAGKHKLITTLDPMTSSAYYIKSDTI